MLESDEGMPSEQEIQRQMKEYMTKVKNMRGAKWSAMWLSSGHNTAKAARKSMRWQEYELIPKMFKKHMTAREWKLVMDANRGDQQMYHHARMIADADVEFYRAISVSQFFDDA